MPKVIEDLSINEISLVQRPAQEGAVVKLVKGEPGRVLKASALTTSVDGHTHFLTTSFYDVYTGVEMPESGGYTSWAGEHTHPWVRDASGAIVLGEADGHTHEIATESAMTQKSEPQVVVLTTEGMTYYKSLDQGGQEAFLALSDAEREKAVTAEVAYVSADGHKFLKSDSPEMVEMAKRLDQVEKANAELREQREMESLAKEADEAIGSILADRDARAAVYKAAKDCGEATVSALVEVNKILALSKEEVGVPEEADGSSAFSELVAKAQEADPKLTVLGAYKKVMGTREGQMAFAEASVQ